MKTLTGREDRLRTRTLYEKPVEWLPQCTPFIGSNNPIRFSTADDAMMQREEVIRFARNYREPDPWLSARLKAEASGILRMLVDHAVAEAELGHVPDLPISVVIERERMAVQTEDALEFITEWMREGRLREDSETPAYRCARVSTLYQQYRYWCDEAGVRPTGRKTFAAVIGRKYPRSQSGGFWHFHGLASTDL
jgi:phage/plasmid-associated DNA primase